MHSPLGATACLPLFSQITKIWSDVWVIDELVDVGWMWGSERQEWGVGFVSGVPS